MQIEIKGPWHEQKAFAEQDRDYFANLFLLDHSFGLESVTLTERKEYRGTCSIELDEFELEKKK